MKITLDRTGGILPTPFHTEINSDNLQSEQVAKLNTIMSRVLPFVQKELKLLPDQYTYSILVEDGNQKHQIKTTDTDASKDLHNLIDYVMDLS